MLAYKAAAHTSTGHSPFSLMMGRNPRLPADLWRGNPKEKGEELASEYAKRLRSQLENVHELVRKSLKIATETQKECYDNRASRNQYQEGQPVWLFNPAKKKGISPKLSRPWVGPYLIIKCLSDVTYRIQATPKGKQQVVHFNRLKPYLGEDPPHLA